MREPAFWRTDGGRGSGSLVRALLTPLGWIYGWATARRIRKTTPVDPGIPVICIGNLTLGGTGKTPIAQTILTRLTDMGYRAHALSRGYGGRLKGPVRVDPAIQGAGDVGDEPLLLARVAPAWISRDRPAGALAAVEAAAQVLVLDDGHQNPTLRKRLSFVVIDGEAGWGANKVFPAGPLREPVTKGLARADAVIVMTRNADTLPDYEGLGLSDLEVPVLHAWLAPTQPPPRGSLVAFAGIGRPQKFFDALQAAGADLSETGQFADHHPYSKGDLKRLQRLATAHDAALITTEKDWVRLPAAMRDDVTAWPVRAEFANPAALDGLLRDMMDASAPGR
ncbi:tetraacyldisaccharide 4'-kinase [uncultured Maricaulis sp.]|uniref:tetraacyldisaccharide 4'-kinase n=1 Tax=uncultured Maricaulis sp. TaxID=174710 RepID=UPI0030D8FF1C|tara:strand:- start:2248 stop:3258 length:1011 start_codon:yes stop_codon:yes gene_type:complete